MDGLIMMKELEIELPESDDERRDENKKKNSFKRK
jgi:hypothetical protein